MPVIRWGAGLVCFALVSACAPSRAAERCFRAEYFAPVGQSDASLFPARVALLPGNGSGEVVSEGSPTDSIGFWKMFAHGGRWVQPSARTLQIRFSNGFSAVVMKLAPSGDSFEGVAEIHYDVLTDTTPAMKARLRPGSCPRG